MLYRKGQLEHFKKLQSSHDTLEREVLVLRENTENVEILQEEKRSLEKKVSFLDDLRSKLARCESERADLQREKDEW